MFDFSWSELAVIALVALVVIGPKDLPQVLRTAGQWARKARAVAREFQGSLEQMIQEAELHEVKDEINRVSRVDLKQQIARTIDPEQNIRNALADPPASKPEAPPSDGVPPRPTPPG